MNMYGELGKWASREIAEHLPALEGAELYPAFIFEAVLKECCGEDCYVDCDSDEWVETYFKDIKRAITENNLMETEEFNANVWHETQRFQLLFCSYLFMDMLSKCLTVRYLLAQNGTMKKVVLDRKTMLSIIREIELQSTEEKNK